MMTSLARPVTYSSPSRRKARSPESNQPSSANASAVAAGHRRAADLEPAHFALGEQGVELVDNPQREAGKGHTAADERLVTIRLFGQQRAVGDRRAELRHAPDGVHHVLGQAERLQ